MWLKWDKSSRLAFIMGNLRGHWDGVGAGCGDANRAVRSLQGISGFTPDAAEKMRMDCGNNYKPSNRTFESYQEVITIFYIRYPEDRIIEIQDVVLLLAGDPKLTAKEKDALLFLAQPAMGQRIVKRSSDPLQPLLPARNGFCRLPWPHSCRFRLNL